MKSAIRTAFMITQSDHPEFDLKNLEEQVKKLQQNPDYIIVTSYRFEVQQFAWPVVTKKKARRA